MLKTARPSNRVFYEFSAASFLFYGAGFASLLALPERPNHFVPMAAQLPARYVPVFTRGCITTTLSGVPVRM
jgi:hypothetical protein